MAHAFSDIFQGKSCEVALRFPKSKTTLEHDVNERDLQKNRVMRKALVRLVLK